MFRQLGFGTLAMLAFVALVAGSLSAQTASQFPNDPAGAPGTNWVGTSGTTGNGDEDQVVVLFFEIPDTTTSTLYFGINDPANTGATLYDQSGTGTSYWYLFGGTGALSDPTSQIPVYPAYPTTEPFAGTQLSAFTEPHPPGTTNDTGWVYFNGVTPSQGEHIGNKYYFKVVLEVDTNVGKNAFQADVSVTNSGTPTGVSGARSFAFVWTPFMSSTTPGSGRTFNFYPFVPGGASGSLVLNAYDFDNGGSGTIYDTTGGLQGSVSITAQSTIDQTFSFPIGIYTNGTWQAQITSPYLSSGSGGTADDLDEVYFNNGSTLLRTYSSYVPPQAADHIASSYGGATVSADGSTTARVVFQVVDANGDPQLISKKLYVDLSSACPSGACRIAAASSTGTTLPAQQAVVTTDGNGIGWVDITDSLASGSENVTFAPITDGVSGTTTPAATSDSLPGVNNAVTVPFAYDPPPEISSASNTTFAYNAASPVSLPAIDIIDSGVSNITSTSDLSIIIPSGLGATFDTAVTSVTVSGASAGTWNVSYANGNKTAVIAVMGNPMALGTTTISGLGLAGGFSASSGSLGIAWDGSTTSAQASDDKTITITAPTYTWTGTTSSSWTTATNWTPNISGGPPATSNARIPVVGTNYPVVASGSVTVADLIIDYGAQMTLNGATGITVNGTFANSGTFTLNGGEAVSLTNSTTSGTIVYAGGGSYTGLALGGSYYNVTFSGTGSYALTGNLTVNGTFAQSAGTLSAGAYTLTVYGNWSHSGGTFQAASSTVSFAGTTTSQISGSTSFATLSCTTAGKTLQFQAGQTQTVATSFVITGAAAPNVLLRSSTTGSQWTLALPSASAAQVIYADVEDSLASIGGGGSVAATYSTDSGNNTNWSFSSFVSWTGATSTSWNTGSNWSSGTVPTAASNVTINPATNEPVLDVAANVNSLSISTGASLDLAGLSLTLATAGTVTDNGTLRLEGGESLSGVTGFSGTGAVNYYGSAGPYTVKDFGATDYPSLQISGSATFNLASSLAVSKDLTVSAGTLAAGANAISVGGNLNLTGSAGFSGTGIVTMSPSSPVTLRSGGKTLPSLTVGGTGSVTLGDAAALSGALSVSSGARLVVGGQSLSVAGSLTDNGSLDNSGAGTVAAGGTVTIGGSYTAGSGTFTFNGGATQNLTPGGQNLGTIATQNASTTVVLQGALAIASATIASGTTVDLNGQGLAASGTLTDGGTLRLQGGETVSIATFAASTGLVDYYGTGGPYASLTAGTSYYDLQFSGSGAGASWKAAAGPISVGGALTIGSGATFDLAGQSLTVTGTATDNGTFRLEGGESVAFGTFAPGAGLVVYYGDGGSTAFPSLAAGSSYANLTFQTAGTNSWTETAATAVSGTLTLSSGTLVTGTNGLSVAGAVTRGSGVIDSGGTVTLDGAAAQNVDFTGSTLLNLTVTNTTGVTLAAATTTVGAALTANTAGAYLLTGGTNLTVGGAADFTNGKLDLGTAGTFTVGGNLSLGTLTGATGATLVLDGAGTQALALNAQSFDAVQMTGTGTVSLTGSATFASLDVSSGETFTTGGAATTSLTVTGALTNAGAVDLASTASGAPTTLTMGSGTTIANSGSFQVTASTGTVTLTSSAAGTALTGTAMSLGANALSLGYFSTAVAHTLGPSAQLTLVGPASFSGGLTLNGASSSLTTGSNALSVSGGLTIANGTVSATGTGSIAAGSSAVSIGASGTLDLGSSASPVVACGALSSSGAITNTAANTIAVGGNLTVTGSFGTPANSTITMSGAQVDSTAQLGSLDVPSGVAVSVSTDPLSLAGSLSIGSGGSVSLAGNNLTVAGSIAGAGSLTPSGTEAISAGGWSVAGFTPQQTQVTFTGGTLTPGASSFYDVAFSQPVALAGSLMVLRNLSIAATGSIAAAANTITVGGSWTNGNGSAGYTYTPASAAAVVFDDNTQTTLVSGTTSFNDLSCTTAGKTIQFQAGAANISVIGGSFTIAGASGAAGLVSLSSQTAGSQWYFSVAGTKSVSYAAVSDSNYDVPSISAVNSANLTPANNTNWSFPPSALTWTGAVSSAWTTGGNWSSGYVPNATDSATVGSGTNDLDVGGLSSATTQITNLTITGTVNASSAGSIGVLGSLSVSGSASIATPANTTWVMSGAGTSVTSSIASSIGNLTVTPGAGNAVSLASPASLASLTLTSGTLAAGAQALAISGSVTSGGGALSSTSMVTLDGLAAQTADFTGSALASLTVSNTSGSSPQVTLTNTAAFTWNGSLLVSAGTVRLASVSQTIGGNVSGAGGLDAQAIAAGGTLTVGGYVGTSGTPLGVLSAPAGSLDVASSWNVTSFTANGGTVAFSGSGTIFSAAAFANLAKTTGGAMSFASGIALDATGNLTVSAGTLTLAGAPGTQSVGGNVGGAGTLDASSVAAGSALAVAGYVGTAGTPLGALLAPAGELDVGGDFDVGSFTHDNGTVLFDGSGTQNVSAATFYNVTMNKAAASVLTPASPGASNNWTIGGAFQLTSGTLNPVNGTGNTITYDGGSWNDGAANVTFAPAAGSVVLGGAGAVALASKPGNHFADLVVGTGSTATAASESTAITATGALTIEANASLTTGANSLSVTGLIAGGGTLAATNATGTPAVSAGSIGTAGNALGALAAPAGAQAISVASNWNVGSYTANGETVTFTGTGTISSSTAFTNLTKSTGGTTSYSGAALSVANALTVSAGTLALANVAGNSVGGSASGAGTLDASAVSGSNSLIIAGTFGVSTFSAASSTTAIGGATATFTNLTANGGRVSLDGAGSAVALTTGGVSFANLAVSGAGPKTVTVSGALIASGGLTIAANNTVALSNVAGNAVGGAVSGGGSLDASAVASSLSFTVGGALTVGSYAATGGTTFVGGNYSPASFTANGGLVDFNGAGAQTLDPSGGVFANLTKSNGTAGAYLTVTSAALQVNGTLTTASANDGVDFGTQNFTVGALSNTGRIRLAGSQAVQSITTMDSAKGIVEYYGAAGGTVELSSFYDLYIDGSGTFALAGPIAVGHNLYILSGTLDAAGNAAITLGGAAGGSSWNQVGGPYGSFNPEQGAVTLSGPGPFTIAGSNSFYDLSYTNSSTSQVIINVETGTTQTIAANGTLSIQGNSAYTPTATGSILVQSTGHTGATSDPAIRWTLYLSNPSNLSLAYLTVWDSAASPSSISPPANVVAGGVENDYNWLGTNLVVSSSTVDSTNDGKIDEIRVTTQSPVDDSFGGFQVKVTGYTVTGYSTGTTPDDNVFYIDLAPGPSLDTGARPVWYITSNTSLMDAAFGSNRVTLANPTAGQTPDDLAAPTIGYTLAIAGKNQIYVRFSEPVVESPGGGALQATDFSYSGAASVSTITRLGVSGSGTSAVLIQLSAGVTANEEVAPATIAVSPVEDMAATPNQMIAADLTHRVSDLGLGMPGQGIVEPLWAKNAITINPVTGGLGTVHLFDGSQSLQAQEITLQALVDSGLAPTASSPSVSLFFDDNVASSLKTGDLWIPPHDPSKYNGLAPQQNAGAASVTGTDTTANAQIRDFTIPSGNAKLQSSTTFDFFPVIDGANPLYCARAYKPNAVDWYDYIAPWSIQLHNIVTQRGDVTILNNVINPSRGDKVYLDYRLASSGAVTINVFSLSGSLVDVLKRGIQGAGSYSTAWNGRNFAGQVVARGIYFIRVVAPGIDEFRKVMIVR